MSLSAAGGAVLIAAAGEAAVKAAIHERASNPRTSGIAAAVAGQVVSRITTGQAAAHQQPAARAKEHMRDAECTSVKADDPAELLASLQNVRSS